MRELEHRFANELAVVGVHSGKYLTERVTPRIREAAVRLGNPHPIVNDRQFRVWRAYAVRAWPTLAIVDPDGYVVGTHAGEFTAEALAPVVARLVAKYDADGRLTRTPLGVRPDDSAVAPGALRYPGKVALDRAGARIAVADSGHHRVLVGRLSDSGRRMTVERAVGGPEPGLVDGAAASARFTAPQGVRFGRAPLGGADDGADDGAAEGETTLWVADSGNHCVRAVALGTGEVRTVAGTGRQLRTQRDMDAGALSSPWDVAQVGDALYVAMAGIHQIWAVDPATGRAAAHAGQFGEDLRDGPHREALLAQPMGIVADPARGRLWFVDAESSAVRWSDLDPAAGRVGTVVGTGLFDFGDRDGTGDDVRLQHPQGLALHPGSGRLLVADTYNDALKWLDPDTRRAEAWTRGFHEPGGVAFGPRGLVYVADTNAHRVAIVDEASGEVSELEIEGLGPRA